MSEIYGTFSTAYVEAMRLRLSALEPENKGLAARVAALEAENKAMRDRVAELDTVLNAAMNCLREATGAVLRLAPLEAEAKQAREDEEWGIANDSDVMSGHGQWTAQYWVDPLTGWISAEAPTIHAALRALRAKVEGGTR